MPDDNDVVLYEVRDAVALLTLNRPERNNGWTLEMEDRYFDLLLQADADPGVRAIVVTGAGRAFSPGADLGTLEDGAEVGSLEFGQLHRRPTTLPLTIRKPIVGAINGAVAGVSLAQALQMDIRFAAAGIKMTFSFPQRGLTGEYGATWLLPRLIGTSRALDLLLSGRVIRSEEALELGLVNRVVPGEELLEAALAYAGELATVCAPTSMAIIKQQVYADWENDLETCRVRVAGLMARSFQGPDFKEGVISFLEKRPPVFLPLGEGGPADLDP
jgi:enoyl-CoA hydratase/carnithine racemase